MLFHAITETPYESLQNQNVLKLVKTCTSVKPDKQLHIWGTRIGRLPKRARSFSLSITSIITTCIKGRQQNTWWSSPHQIKPTHRREDKQTGSSRGYILFLQESSEHCFRLPASIETVFSPQCPQNFEILCHSSSALACPGQTSN